MTVDREKSSHKDSLPTPRFQSAASLANTGLYPDSAHLVLDVDGNLQAIVDKPTNTLSVESPHRGKFFVLNVRQVREFSAKRGK